MQLNKTIILMLLVSTFWIVGGCATSTPGTKEVTVIEKVVKTIAEYEEVGTLWGEKHFEEKRKPEEIDMSFVDALIAEDKLYFFWVHSDLKEAFKRGYRIGYQDRTADLVLGPHLTEAAAQIGKETSTEFVNVVNVFEEGWGRTLKRAIDVFIVLISEGSQADREDFIKQFTTIYGEKYHDTRRRLQEGTFISQQSEGGTVLYIDPRKTSALLDIPSEVSLKEEIYLQTFRVMGDEWGRRLSHNLIKRDELVDLLRRSKTALQEVPDDKLIDTRLRENLRIIYLSFLEAYGTDAENVFMAMIKDAGYEHIEDMAFSPSLRDATPKNKPPDEIREVTPLRKKIITISSNVRNDVVYVNGKEYGPTRFQLEILEGTTYEITVTKPGYQSVTKYINYNQVQDGGLFRIILEKLP